MKRFSRIVERALIAVGAPVAAVSMAAALTPLPAELAAPVARGSESVRVVDRTGRTLREVRADDQTRAMWVDRDALATLPVRAMVAAEDRRFYGHAGVDPVAVARALVANAAQRRITSGASTLTMQLARLLRPHRRSFAGKVSEALLALRIEATVSKDRIVVEYANRAPFGPNVRGFGAASALYFDKAPAELSAGEAALVASLPRGPTLYDPQKFPERAAARRARVLTRMNDFGLLEDDATRAALAEPTTALAKVRPLGASHYVAALLGGALGPVPANEGGTVRGTLDGELQADVEHAVRTHVRALDGRHVTAGAALVLDNVTGEILAYVGSPSPFDRQSGGFNDGVRARRQAGSTLKPFLYGLALDRGEIDGATILRDAPLSLPIAAGVFVPQNYDGKFHGSVRARVALASSLNVPAVMLAERVGVGDFLERLRVAGFSLPETPEHYGVALALGDGEVSLLELVRAYATLARGGEPVMSPSAAWRIADMLADREARLPAFGERNVLDLPIRAAVKTGTSKGFRDNWAVGFTKRVTAGVWVGNFDGSSMRDVSGVAGAGPILRATLLAAESATAAPARTTSMLDAAPPADHGLVRAKVCAMSGKRSASGCRHETTEWLSPAAHEARGECGAHEHDRDPSGSSAIGKLRIEHPVTASRYYLDAERGPSFSGAIGVRLRVPSSDEEVALEVNGREVARAKGTSTIAWTPRVGHHTLVAVAKRSGRSEPVEIEVE